MAAIRGGLRWGVPFLVLLAGAPVAPAGLGAQEVGGGTTGRAEPWTVDDLLLQESAGEFDLSPDGKWVVWVRSKMDGKEGRRVSNLWITRIEDGESWALTRGKDTNRAPRWSPDGSLIAFVSSRKPPEGEKKGEGAGPQLWAIRLQGGEPWPLTRSVRGLRGFRWKGKGADTLVFLAREERARFEEERKERKDDAVAVEDTLDAPPVRLWLLEVESGRIRRLTRNRDWIEDFALSPDGRRAVVRAGVSLSYRFDARVPPRTYLVDLETGERTEVPLGERVVPSRMEWDPEGRGFYYAYAYSTHPVYRSASITLVGYFDAAEGRAVPVELGWERGLGQGFRVVPGGFLALLADGVRDRPARYERRKDGWRRRMIEGEHADRIWGWTVSRDGRLLAYTTSSASSPPQPYVARLEGSRLRDPVRLAELNPSLRGKPLPRAEIVRWTGARDEEVEGILYYPLDYEPGRPRPLVVNIHGGPAGRDADRWDQSWASPIVLWNQKGAFVLQVNYHGSCCYGLEWVESIGGGRYYSLEVPDIERGVDYLIDRGLVHPDSVATQGWSNGAILSTALTVENPERYRASLAGAGDVEWISDWGNVDFGAAFDNYYFGASPLEDPERYIELSPFFRLDRVRTPTLIFFGTEDRNVPPSQGWSHFRALQQLGNTEVRLVLFPGEPHGLRKLAHQRRKVEEEVRWLDRHLWGRPDTANLALDEDSPLGTLLRLAGARRVDGLYGVEVKGILVPETVEVGGIELGRFEVTRAQWRAFDPDYPVPPGTENYPASGISFDRALEYVEWLSERTGEAWRLPRKEELGPLAREAEGGITLDWWAGYAPNPEDRERLARAVARLPGEAPLLREVGSYPGDGAVRGAALFDLGGNVAEWAVDGDGAGVLVGGSADRPRKGKGPAEEAAPAYRGLRVVRGEGPRP